MRYILFTSIILLACKGDKKPIDVLPQEKMQAVLYDVIQADEMVDFLKMGDSTYQPFSRRTGIYDTIFQLHGIKKEMFRQSMQYYQGRPDLLKEILEKLQEKVANDTSGRNRQPLE